MKVYNTMNIESLNNYLKKFELTDNYEEADIIIGVLKEEQLKKCRKLKFYQHAMAGSDMLRADMFPDGCKVCNASGTFGVGISEYVIGSLIYLMRNFKTITLNQQNSKWERIWSRDSIYGSTVLLVGLGDIGMECAKRLKPFNTRLMGIRRHIEDKPYIIDEIYSLDNLDSVIKECDIVICSLPKSKATDKLLTGKQFGLMKEGSYLVNVGRGNVLDLDDLYESLKSKHLSGAALDVFESEPLDESHPIWKLDNVLITPHIAGGMDLDTNKELFSELTANNIENFINNRQLKNEVDFETGYRRYIRTSASLHKEKPSF